MLHFLPTCLGTGALMCPSPGPCTRDGPLRDRASIKLQRVQGLGMTKGAWRLIRSSNESLIHKSKHFPSINLHPVKGYV